MSLPDEPVSARPEEIESLLERVRRNQLGEQDLRLLERLLRLLLSVVRFLEQKNTVSFLENGLRSKVPVADR
jgi:hypothetical protein